MTQSDAGKPRFLLTLEALPDDRPALVRLRLALKRLLRTWKLRCVEVRQWREDAGKDQEAT